MDNEKPAYLIAEADLSQLISQLESVRANLLLPRKLNQSIASSINAVNDCLKILTSIRSQNPQKAV